jgi:hypothetical protein
MQFNKGERDLSSSKSFGYSIGVQDGFCFALFSLGNLGCPEVNILLVLFFFSGITSKCFAATAERVAKVVTEGLRSCRLE